MAVLSFIGRRRRRRRRRRPEFHSQKRFARALLLPRRLEGGERRTRNERVGRINQRLARR